MSQTNGYGNQYNNGNNQNGWAQQPYGGQSGPVNPPLPATAQRNAQPVFCPYCNSPIPLGYQDAYCPECGAPNPYYQGNAGAGGAGATPYQPIATPTAAPQKKGVPIVLVALGAVFAGIALGFAAWKIVPLIGSSLNPPAETSDAGAEDADAPADDTSDDVSADEGADDTSETPATGSDAQRAASFSRNWSGTFDGYSQYVEGGVLTTYVRMSFDSVTKDGTLTGTCDVETYDSTNGTRRGSYEVEGTIDWDTRSVDIYGTRWIDDSDFVYMREFKGKLTADMRTMNGTSVTLSGEHEGKWRQTATN